MATVLIKHTVEDYETWKAYYDDHASTREEFGERGYRLYHVADDPNEIVILFEWDSPENAQEFLETSDLPEVMESAGVMGEPEVYHLDEIETKTPE
ncbi:MAG TPA: hypothetical protein VE134_05495 [Methanomicrobiales archaeon]|nr:hypothetical protein [Methanomicrobiales archaeon]